MHAFQREPRCAGRAASSALLVVGCVVASCGGGDADVGFGLEERVPVTGLTFPTVPSVPGPVAAVDAFPSLSFSQPVLLTHAGDGTDRVFVAELGGRVHVFPNEPTATTTAIFLDLSAEVLNGGERGLLGFAFHPDYATTGYVYVHYSTPTTVPGMDHRSVLARYTVSGGDPDTVDPASATVLLELEQPFSNHNGGMLAFGPDDRLYVALGDGGSAHDPGNNAQNLGTLLGSMLRLEPDGSVPADNPFVGQPGVREEIWAYGLRNPWRFSFDRNTGALWCGDVGQNTLEEITFVERGGNHGWDLYEGAVTHDNPGGVPFASTVPPVHTYPTQPSGSVTGGYVYRGSANPSLAGAYVYADFVRGTVWALQHDGIQATSNTEIAWVANPSSFGEDEAGELYVCSFDGHVYRFEEVGGGGPATFPQLLSETGLFSDTVSLTPAPGVIEYDVNVPLWSDGARKRRWIALPGIAHIAFDPIGAWQFPVGTVLVKHFELDVAPGTVRRLETRVLIHETGGWQGYTYRWNAAGTDADLLVGAESDTFTVEDPDAPGGMRSQTWNFPSRTDCLQCHTLAAGRVLGVRTAQLARDFAYPAQVDDQLRAWNHIGLFTTDIGPHTSYAGWPAPDDTSAPLAERARAVLAANCAHCHRPGGPTPVAIDLRAGIATSQMNAVWVVPQAGDLGLASPFLIAPGDRASSIVWERMQRLDATRMPTLGSALVDEDGSELVGAWIDAGAD